MQKAAKSEGQLQQLLNQHSQALTRHARQLTKLLRHDASGQLVGRALLQLLLNPIPDPTTPIPSTDSTSSSGREGTHTDDAAAVAAAQAQRIVAVVGVKPLLRFGSMELVLAAVDADLASAADALLEACRRTPQDFITLLQRSLDVLDTAALKKVSQLSHDAALCTCNARCLPVVDRPFTRGAVNPRLHCREGLPA